MKVEGFPADALPPEPLGVEATSCPEPFAVSHSLANPHLVIRFKIGPVSTVTLRLGCCLADLQQTRNARMSIIRLFKRPSENWTAKMEVPRTAFQRRPILHLSDVTRYDESMKLTTWYKSSNTPENYIGQIDR